MGNGKTSSISKNYVLRNVTKKDFGITLYDLIKDTSGKFIQKYIPTSPLFRYFLNYLKFDNDCLNVRTIVRENRYTCQNYLEDYAIYYAKCYTEYDKYCKRVHFFSVKFDDAIFSQMIQTPTHKCWRKYLGCIVIKPLPKGIIGITYLDVYKNKKIERHYTCLCTKTINLFGHEYKIKTMPFKEQDGVVASCATTALWMAFQKTSELFNTKAPSLSEITILAGDANSNSGKIFPSKGLELYQVCKAISNNGLISEIRTNFANKKYFKNFVYAYIRGEIPVLLELKFTLRSEYHLVTVNGYKFDETKNGIKEETTDELKYVSDKIARFYVHDDQIGPFAKIMFDDSPSEEDRKKSTSDYELITPWWKQDEIKKWTDYISALKISNKKNLYEKVSFTPLESLNEKEKDLFEKAIPTAVVVPLHPAIKITFEDIYEQQLIISFVTTTFIDFGFNILWDIFIMKSNEYKKLLINEFKSDNKVQVEAILTQSLPLYIWVIQAKIQDKLCFDYIYDTIELNKSGQPVAINIYENKLLSALSKDKTIEPLCSNGFFIDKYKNSLICVLNKEMYYHVIDNTAETNAETASEELCRYLQHNPE